MSGTTNNHDHPMTAGETPAAADDTSSPFQFVGDVLALDLVNTEVVVRRRPIDLLAAPGAYAAWWHAAAARYPGIVDHLLATDIAANPELLPAVVALRSSLRAIFSAVAAGTPLPAGDLVVLNRALGNAHDAIALGAAGEPRSLLVPRAPDADGPLAAVARSAFDLLTAADQSRLHRCANGHCVLLFYDATKSATRRWCSTACMNRARSSDRYRASKRGDGARSTTGSSPVD
jgi:predicted RNA-binding Zn ribbon-like protein